MVCLRVRPSFQGSISSRLGMAYGFEDCHLHLLRGNTSWLASGSNHYMADFKRQSLSSRDLRKFQGAKGQEEDQEAPMGLLGEFQGLAGGFQGRLSSVPKAARSFQGAPRGLPGPSAASREELQEPREEASRGSQEAQGELKLTEEGP